MIFASKEFRIEWSHLVLSTRDECGSPLIFISQKRRWRKWDRALGFPGNSTEAIKPVPSLL